MIKVFKIAFFLRDEPLIQGDNRLSRGGATWLKHKPEKINVMPYGCMCVCVCVCWRWGGDILKGANPLVWQCMQIIPKIDQKDNNLLWMADWNMLFLNMNGCAQSRNQLFQADSWTAHNQSAYDLRGIWSRPVSDPGLSVLTKHPSVSTNSALEV